jgi:probable HAF family extracellular repeat protein
MALALVGRVLGQAVGVPNYTVIDLGTLGGSSSFAAAINKNGQVVGQSKIAGDIMVHPFLYTNGSMQDIGVSGISGYATSINSSGQIVGLSGAHAFLYSNGSMQDIGTLGNGSSVANGVNDAGQIAGYVNFGSYQTAFLYANGSMQDIGGYSANGINNGGQIAGQADQDGGAFIYSNGLTNYLGVLGGAGNYSMAIAINNSGQVVGASEIASNTSITHAFLFSNNSMQDIGSLGGTVIQQFGINASGQVVGASFIGTNKIQHAFLHTGGQMYDLNNLLFATNSGWTISAASGINDAGQIVGQATNLSGQAHAVLLNPLAAGSIQAISTPQQSVPTYGDCPTPQPGADSLVVITHGWTSLGLYPNSPPDPVWVDQMSNAIVMNLTDSKQSNWQVFAYKWVQKSWTFRSQDALNNATQEGVNLGNSIATQKWANVHLIAHSAGAGLIQAASERIKALSPNTIVQCTFLDAFIGSDKAGVTNYGIGADWADSYFSRDVETGSLTEGILSNAFNVDVTQLDNLPQDRYQLALFYSTSSKTLAQCYKTESTHSWPVVFYSNSISGNVSSDYDGFGWPLSVEGGLFSLAETTFEPGNASPLILGNPDPCSINPIQSVGADFHTYIDFVTSDAVQSATGFIQKFINASIHFFTGSPVWTGTVVTSSNAVNLVSFDAQFTSGQGAAGVFTVYWDTNVIGVLDERTVQPGFQHYTLSFPNAAANSSHILGFHLDPFTAVQSSIVLTNVTTSQAGISQPFSLTVTTNTSNGLLIYELAGQSGFNYYIQASADLINWTNIAILANTNGTVDFADTASTNSSHRFYRAMAAQ